MSEYSRSSGILLHPTSLPSEYGIGELGGAIFKFIDKLSENKQSLWQILPLGPTGYGDSPYQAFSSFAGNPLIISIEELIKNGLLDKPSKIPPFDDTEVEYGKVIEFKYKLIRKAYNRFKDGKKYKRDFNLFCKKQDYWLDTYALYRTLKSYHDEKPWNKWQKKYRKFDEDALNSFRKSHEDEIELIKFRQYIFNKQWKKVKNYANKNNIQIIGDIPIFVAYDSEDTWANQELFQLDEKGNPTHVAGVPPDYFSETGQLWGNPLYDWDKLEETNFEWWIKRVKRNLEFCDMIRVDHFRGFEGYWAVPSDEKTAINGEWKKAKGREFFNTLKNELGEIPILAEDLGVITEEVENLRDSFNFPGMKILQYGFNEDHDATNEFLPHNYERNCIVYTGTHDNNTIFGWYLNASKEIKNHFVKYTGSNRRDIVSDMLRLAWSSVAMFSICPLQEVFRENSSARMNYPGKAHGNWRWRSTKKQLFDSPNWQELCDYTELYNRVNRSDDDEETDNKNKINKKE